MTTIVNFKVLFDPLTHLSVVQEAALHKLVNIQIFLDSVFVESSIEDFVVVLVLVLGLGVPFNLLHGHTHGIDLIN